jgi:hypothetical protein
MKQEDTEMIRREFMGQAAAAVAAAMAAPAVLRGAEAEKRAVRVGIIGMGGRGTGHLRSLLGMPGAAVPAICDLDPAAIAKAQAVAAKLGAGEPEGYSGSTDAYKRLMERDDLDAVIITTPWNWHATMAVAAMKCGKYAASEVPLALTLEECWQVIDTHEATKVPCMMLENWSFRRDNLAVLNMIRKGLFGQIVHCHCSYSHNCLSWYFDPKGNPRWSAAFLIKKNASQYSTHGMGPVPGWMDLNCGDRIDYLTSTATAALGINDQLARKFGPDHPWAKQKYLQGDIVTSVARTVRGKTIVINFDTTLPRPYDNRWMIQGTRGIYSEAHQGVYLDSGKSVSHPQWQPFAPFQEKYDHALWKNLTPEEINKGHGGTDYVELRAFLDSVRSKTQTPLDVYDSVLISAIIPLSEKSIAQRSAPVEFPDFTRGKWETTKPKFAVDLA